MPDPDRIDTVLDVLRERWTAEPDLRLGQLIANALSAARPDVPAMPELFYLEDDELIRRVKSWAPGGTVPDGG